MKRSDGRALGIVCAGAAVVLLLTSTLAFAISQSVELSSPNVERKAANPGDFVTVPFVIKSDSPAPETFSLKVIAPDSISIISATGELIVSPGEEKRFALTFLIGAGAPPGEELSIKLKAESISRQGVGAEAVATIAIEARQCAEISGIPDIFEADGGQRAVVKFNVKNCGPSIATFHFDITALPELALFGKPADAVIEAGKSAVFQFTAIPSDKSEEYKTQANINVVSKKMSVTKKPVEFAVKKYLSQERRDARQYIPISLKLERKIASNMKSATGLKISMPTFRDNTFSMKSEAWIESGGDGLAVNRGVSEIGYGDSDLVLGTQRVGVGEITGRNRELEGWKFSRDIGSGKVSFLKGGDDSGNVSQIKIDQNIAGKLRIGAGRTVTDSLSGKPMNVETENIYAGFDAGTKVKFYTEFAHTRADSTALTGDIGDGSAFRLSGSYKDRNFTLSALAQNGSAGFIGDGFRDGIEAEASYRSGKSQFFLGFKNRISWRFDGGAALAAPQSFEYKNARAGWSLKPGRRGLSTTITVESSEADRSFASENSFSQNSEKFISAGIMKKKGPLEIKVNVKQGVRSDGIAESGFRDTGISGKYRYGDFVFGAGITNQRDFEQRAMGADSVDNFMSMISYTPDHGRNSFQISHSVNTNVNADGFSTRGIRTSMRLNSKISKQDTLMMKYDIFKTAKSDNSNFSASVSRSLDLKIPYKKNGAISGMVFIDANRNGIFDSTDTPLPGVVFRVKGEGAEASSESGRFEFRNMPPGRYTLNMDKNSYPAGVSAVEKSISEVKVGAGDNVEIPILFEPLYKISGTVNLDSANPMLRFSKIGVSTLRIVLKSGGGVAKEAFTDATGKYYFEQVTPGKYEIELDNEWLSKDATIIGSKQQQVVCGAAEHKDDDSALAGSASSRICDGKSGCDGYDFVIAPREKKIIKTFTD